MADLEHWEKVLWDLEGTHLRPVLPVSVDLHAFWL